jgi:hypothetical protein
MLVFAVRSAGVMEMVKQWIICWSNSVWNGHQTKAGQFMKLSLQFSHTIICTVLSSRGGNNVLGLRRKNTQRDLILERHGETNCWLVETTAGLGDVLFVL